MSETATNLVWSESQSTRGARLVMLAIARIADENGKATATLEQISKLTRLSARSISKCLVELAALGELGRQRGGGNANPNSYSILLGQVPERASAPAVEVPSSVPEALEAGTSFPEDASQKGTSVPASENVLPSKSEVSSSRARGGNTPYGSITTTQKQAGLLGREDGKKNPVSGSVEVPEGAKELVSAITSAGMIVGWRLDESEWARVTALADRWGPERLVELVTRRWNVDRPPQSARYLLRIWDDLPSSGPSTSSTENVVPLRRQPGGWAPFQNTAKPSAYQNGF